MRNFIVSIIVLSSLVFGSGFASEISSLAINETEGKSKSSFEKYEEEMKSKDLPLTLIVGCGHCSGDEVQALDGDHMHPNCWCVNLETNPWYFGSSSYWEVVKADECMNITDSSLMSKAGMLYKEKFDIVVLERIEERSLNNPRTFYNATSMLKEGGALEIDSHASYAYPSYRQYEQEYINKPTNLFKFLNVNSSISPKFLEDCEKQLKNLYGANFNMPNILKKLEKFGMHSLRFIATDTSLCGLADYLYEFGMTDIITIRNAPQPYTTCHEQSYNSIRFTSILSATKTQKTTALMRRYWE